MIQKLVHGLDEASTEHVELERIFNEFFQGTRGLQTQRSSPVLDKGIGDLEDGAEIELDQLLTYRREAIIMLFELDQVEDFERINPLELGIDEDYIRDMLDEPEDDRLESSFVEELREYQVILDSPDPDIVRLSEILNDLIEYVLDTDSAYVMFRVILKVFHERQRKEKQKKEGAKKGHSPQNRGAYLEEFSSSDSFEPQHEVQSQQDAKRAKAHGNQIYAQNLTDTFGEVNASAARDEARSDQQSRQQRRLFLHKRQSSWNEHSPASRRHGSRRQSKRGSVLDSSFHLSVKQRGEGDLTKKHTEPVRAGHGKSASKQGSRQQSKKELHKKNGSSKPNNEDRRADALGKIRGEPHTPPPVSDAHLKKVRSEQARPQPRPSKAGPNAGGQRAEQVGRGDPLDQSLTATPTMDNLIPPAQAREEAALGEDARIKAARRASMMNSIFRLNEQQRHPHPHTKGAGEARGSKPIYLDGMDGAEVGPYADQSQRSKHNKTLSGQSSSMVTETSQSFVSGAAGNRAGGLDVSADRRAYASAERSHSVEVGEDEEVEQLMQMHDDLVGGGDSNQD